jgi:salicylate hydroxylase
MASFISRNDPIDIAIVGAGIGGTATAVALGQAGFTVDLFEQAPELREVGGAVVIREPSMSLLARWGVLDDLRPKMVEVSEVEVRDGRGSILGSTPTAVEEGEAKSAFSVHRADLHDALASKMSRTRLHLGHRLASLENGSSHAEAAFENGRRIQARLIVGADGLRSIVRTLFDATPMTFLKLVTNRTIAPAFLLPANMPNDRLRTWLTGDLRFLLLPIRAGAEVSISAGIPTQTPPEILWSATSADQLLSAFANFDPLINRVIEGRTVDVTTHPIYDKEPITNWADRRVVLLGDAAHPMSPMNGQGANQAIQDAGALTAAMVGRYRDNLPSALAEYQFARAPVTARIQTLSRKPPPALARLMAAGR